MAEPSDADIEAAVREILDGAKLEEVTHGIIRGKLAERFGLDLTPRKGFIKDLTLTIINEKTKADEHEEEEEEEEGEEAEEEEDEEEEEEEEEERKPKKKRGGGGGGGGGFAAMVDWSDKMTDFLGTSRMPRTQVTKFLWQYIKANDLQKPGDKRVILCDDKLQRLFGVKQINMLTMSKAVSKHALPKDGYGDEEDDDGDDDDDDDDGSSAPKKPKVKKSGSSSSSKQAPAKDKGAKKPRKLTKIPLSSELQAVVGEPAAARTEVVSRLWEYIKSNNLQNPADKREILCDGPLKKVFGQSSVNMFSMNKLLGRHFLK